MNLPEHKPSPGTDAWLAQINEEIIDPERPIIDPHHHLWKKHFATKYLLADFWKDTTSGHNIVKSVYVECRSFYRRDGPEHLMPLGETETVAGLARESLEAAIGSDTGLTHIAGIVAHADLTLAREPEKLEELLQGHQQAGAGLIKGIRHSGARDSRPENLIIPGRAPAYLYGREDFRAGLRTLAKHGFTYDTWHFHHQNEDFLELAQAVPEVTMILDHFGTPLGVGIYRGNQDTIYQQWKQDIAQIAKCPNVYAKLGGLAMPDNGFGWDKRDLPPDSDELVKRQQKYYMHTIECFGPQRCMFESNFPVDRLSLPYHVVWNGFKKLVSDFSEEDKHAMFYGNAEKVYRLT